MNKYIELKKLYSGEYQQLDKNYKGISFIRLLVFVLFFYCGFKALNLLSAGYTVATFIALIAFVVLMRVHNQLSKKRLIKEKLVEINEEEITYLNGDNIPFNDGKEYIDFDHFFTFDLDVFGANSLFQNLNRTATYPGSKRLAQLLKNVLSNEEIIQNQKAITELTDKVQWRQNLLALAKITNDNQKEYNNLLKWTKSSQDSLSKVMVVLFYLVPLLFVASFATYFIKDDELFFHIATGFFIFNLFLAATQSKRLKKELIDSDHITTIIAQYGFILEQIEKEEFKSEKLIRLKGKLATQSDFVSQKIKKLHTLFSNVESVQNGFAAVLFNGSFLYHIHKLNALIKWKQQHAADIKEWIDVIGEFEALNSMANFSFNNASFVYPTLNSEWQINFLELGHPLIPQGLRVCNDIAFKNNSFIILTGSNMSGKSTFLRTLGINMVLGGIGAPVCATEANIHPLDVIVSMRQKDSLNEGESYFFAEVKRLKKIMVRLDEQICFVLMDEILKGTNSDDKQTGTIEVIKKVISKNAIGCIATHDLEVCKTTDDYPDVLRNKCFEVEIINNDLSFDYKLRDGVCKNKSATFIMKKIEII